MPGLISFVLLAISIAALGLGPLIYRWLRTNEWALSVLDGIVTIGVGGLILLHVLPPAFVGGGFASLLFLMLGLVVPTVMERVQHGRFDKAHRAAVVFAAVALIVHSLADGLALSQGDAAETLPIALAVVLHRLPVSLAIWLVFRPSQGLKVAIVIFGLIAAGTIAGFFAGPWIFSKLDGPAFAWAQAFVAGSLLHVIFHAHEHDHDHAHGPGHSHHHHNELPSKPQNLALVRIGAPLAPLPRVADSLGASGFAASANELKLSLGPSGHEHHCCGPDEWDVPGARGWARVRRYLGFDAIQARGAELFGALLGLGIVGFVTKVEQGAHDHSSHAGHSASNHVGHDHAGHDHAGHDHAGHDHLDLNDVSALLNGSDPLGHVHPTVIDIEGWERILELALGAAPYLVLGYFLAGLVCVVLPAASIAWLNHGSSISQSIRGVIFGFPQAIRACSVVPAFEHEMARGAKPAGAVSSLIASPHLRPEAILFSLPLLGLPLAGVRIGVVMLAAIVGGWFISRFVEESPKRESVSREDPLTFASGMRHGFFRVVDDTAPWVLVAFLTVGVVAPSSLEFFSTWPVLLEVLFFAALGIPVYLCSSAAMPVSALLIAAGVSPGAALVFVLAGPVAYVATNASMRVRFGRSTTLGLITLLTLVFVASGVFVDEVMMDLIVRTQPDLVHLDHESHRHQAGNVVQWVALAAIGVLFTSSLLRRGPRAWLNTVVAGDHG